MNRFIFNHETAARRKQLRKLIPPYNTEMEKEYAWVEKQCAVRGN